MLPWLLLPWLVSAIIVGKCSYDDLKAEESEKSQQFDTVVGHSVEGQDGSN